MSTSQPAVFKRTGNLLYRRFLNYFLPTLMVTLSSNLAAAVDQIIVGNFLGPRALAAVSLTLPYTYAIAVVYLLFGIGGAIIAAVAMGKREREKADEAFSAAIWGMILVSLLVTLIGLARLDALAGWLAGRDANLVPIVRSYLRPLMIGAFVLVIVPGCGEFMRLDGQPKLVSVILAGANLVNLVCDVIFIRITGDVSGAAWASVTGYSAGLACLWFYVRSPVRTLRLRPPGSNLMRLLAAVTSGGFAGAADMVLFLARAFLLNSIVLSVGGETAMAAFSVCLACMSLSFIFVAGAAQTMMPIAGVLRGEGDCAGIRFILRETLLFAVGGALLLVAVFEAVPGIVLGIFGLSEAAEMAIASPALRVFAPSLPGIAITSVMIYYYQTQGKPALSFAVSVTESLVLQISIAWLLSRFWGLTGLWVSFPLTEVICVGLIFCMASFVSKRSGGAVSGIALLPPGRNGSAMDVTIPASLSDAETLSAMIVDFGKSEGLDEAMSTRLGVAAEEMSVNTIKHGYGAGTKHFIDIAVNVTDDDVILTLRDDGRPFNPTTYGPGEAEDFVWRGIDVVKAISDRVEYSYSLGFNNSAVYLKRQP
jgi:Na+-driven multidrug efflux pump/anti-sigma regulatory factor (Ser/Thr protein kinase)